MQAGNLRWVGLYALAMAYLEAAVVVYLRRMYGIVDLMHNVPPFDPKIAPIEVGREVATLIMLLAVGWAAGRTRQSRLGFTVFAFGLWDIFYYVWLKLFLNWPGSLLTPDILFLIPLPWWGPVIGPALIAILMTAGGLRAVVADDRGHVVRLQPVQWAALIVGALMMLYAFMENALAALPADMPTLSQLRPATFSWPIYQIGLALSGVGLWRIISWRSEKGSS